MKRSSSLARERSKRKNRRRHVSAEPREALWTQPIIRRLEPRRVLNAAVQALVVPTAAVEGDTVQVSAEGTGQGELQFDWTIQRDGTPLVDGTGPVFRFVAPDEGIYDVELQLSDEESTTDVAVAHVTVSNAAPQVESFSLSPVDENRMSTLTAAVADPGINDAITLEIDWSGAGLLGATEVIQLNPSERTVAIEHRFTSDELASSMAPTLLARDGDGGESSGVTASGLAPGSLVIARVGAISEGETATLRLSFMDPDMPDSHTVTIDWGDRSKGNDVQLAAGVKSLVIGHVYQDNPAVGESFLIDVTVVDAEGNAVQGTTDVRVDNDAPNILFVDPVAMINENGTAELLLGFGDAGRLDEHTVTIDWGDGTTNIETLVVGAREIFRTHRYLDDPARADDLYSITVTIVDDAGARVDEPTSVLVKNVAPSGLSLNPVQTIITEGDEARLSLAFSDPGTVDAHTVTIDWGDGTSPETVSLPVGARNLTTMHTYRDDIPSGTTEDQYTVHVTVGDDDGGQATQQTSVLVQNDRPNILFIDPVAMIDENQTAELLLGFGDAGRLDEHTLTIDWGDGTITSETLVVGTREIFRNHQYLDDDPSLTPQDTYTITVTIADDDSASISQQTPVLVKNVEPLVTNITAGPSTIVEGDTTTLSVAFSDPGTRDTHTATIDWGDGSTPDLITLPAGMRQLTRTHLYDDDVPSGTPQDDYTINVTVTDDDSGSVSGTAVVTVKNELPSALVIDPVAMINENGIADLSLRFTDAGLVDEHSLTINWGDGTETTETLSVGTRSIERQHQYLDDNPSGTTEDNYTITVTVVDDDTGSVAEQTSVLVKNVEPSISNLAVTPSMIDENGVIDLDIAFADPGSLDTHTVTVDWGDGTDPQTVELFDGERSLDLQHQYLDDNPTGTPQDEYTITVTIVDDDTGSVAEQTSVLVKNVEPSISNLVVTPSMIDENGVIDLDIAFADPGSLDTHTVTVDWGDGTDPQTVELFDGERSLDLQHQYLDDNPTGTPQDEYTITVTIVDDDTGSVAEQTSVLVKNVAPSITDFAVSPSTISVGQLTTLSLSFDDIGTLDTHTVTVDWGNGTSENLDVAPGERTFTTTHVYVNGPSMGDTFVVTATVTDDDGGAASAMTEITVISTGPRDLVIDPVEMITEGDSAQLSFSFVDDGPQNAHTITIDWGDGTTTTETLMVGERQVFRLHQYVDDDPTSTPQDTYTITVTVADDSDRSITGNTTVLVKNADPAIVALDYPSMIDENGVVDLRIDFADAGLTDTHTIMVNWGDGTDLEVEQLTDAERSINLQHRYVDDNPTSTPQDSYTITVSVMDDDTGTGTQQATVLVKNVDPMVTSLTVTPSEINETEFVALDLQFADPGTLDTHTVIIDWGDGSEPAIIDMALGQRGLSTLVDHQYLDDNPPGTPRDPYTINVTVMDDDTGIGSANTSVDVRNVNPHALAVEADEMISTDGIVSILVEAGDIGPDLISLAEAGQIGTAIGVDLAVHENMPDTFGYVVVLMENDAGLEEYVELSVVDVLPPQVPDTIGYAAQVRVVLNARFTPQFTNNRLSESADVVMAIRVVDDDTGTALTDPFFLSVPGIETKGDEFFFIQVGGSDAEFVRAKGEEADVVLPQTGTVVITFQATDLALVQAELVVGSGRHLALQVIRPDGTDDEPIIIDPDVLFDLRSFFAALPDNLYRVLLIQEETNTVRVVVEATVRRGKAIDPADKSDGTQERPPRDQQLNIEPGGAIPQEEEQPQLEYAPGGFGPPDNSNDFVPQTNNSSRTGPSNGVAWQVAVPRDQLPHTKPAFSAPIGADVWEQLGKHAVNGHSHLTHRSLGGKVEVTLAASLLAMQVAWATDVQPEAADVGQKQWKLSRLHRLRRRVLGRLFLPE